MKRNATRAYLNGFGTVRSVLENDRLTVDEILISLDPHRRSDLGLTPGRAGTDASRRFPPEAPGRGSSFPSSARRRPRRAPS